MGRGTVEQLQAGREKYVSTRAARREERENGMIRCVCGIRRTRIIRIFRNGDGDRIESDGYYVCTNIECRLYTNMDEVSNWVITVAS